MILSSGTFLIFLLVCLLLHYILPPVLRNFWLLLSSIAFFAYAMPAEAVVMMIFCLIVYLLGWLMAAARGTKRLLLVCGIFLGTAFLVFYKYLGFLASLLGMPTTAPVFSLIAPMGVSYVTFQCIAYLVEIYKGRMEPEDNPIDFFVYALFFAKITAGPIEAPAAFLAQLKQERSFTWSRAQKGLLLISMGFIKKIVVADFLATGVAAVFSTGGSEGGWSVVLASVMYAIQLLYDFSGYTDIARGSAVLFGIELTENFNHPYMATSVRDFWRRWHISLSTWLRNYIYIPLGGSRVGTARRYANVFATFLVSGIWHGASLTYVFWGVLHGAFQVLEMLLEPVGKKLRLALSIAEDSRVLKILGQLQTFVLVTVAWVFFRADSIETAFQMLGTLLVPWGSFGEALKLCGLDITALLLIVSGLVSTNQIEKLLRCEFSGNEKTLPVFAVCVITIWAVFLVHMVAAASGGESSFIYFDF